MNDDLVRRLCADIQRTTQQRRHPTLNLSTARAAAVASAAIIADGADSSLARTGNARCAARYAHLWGCSIEATAHEFGVGLGAVLREWSTLYSTRPTRSA